MRQTTVGNVFRGETTHSKAVIISLSPGCAAQLTQSGPRVRDPGPLLFAEQHDLRGASTKRDISPVSVGPGSSDSQDLAKCGTVASEALLHVQTPATAGLRTCYGTDHDPPCPPSLCLRLGTCSEQSGRDPLELAALGDFRLAATAWAVEGIIPLVEEATGAKPMLPSLRLLLAGLFLGQAYLRARVEAGNSE
ncbi:hypothetical protein PG985_004168 [Apiospora marii]|uniref:Uncharacterized protein n=1 Tax=Apiospora marii TaxID=335849 RepID=A0ABR1S8I8_9PEZI